MVEVLHDGEPEIICCGKPMAKMEGNTVDAAREKHVPVIEGTAGQVLVKVGSVPHPMEKEHFIEWIELIADNHTYRIHLKPGETAQATFPPIKGRFTVREYCNLHGLWKAES
jgi:superoxide reductase